MDDKHKEKECGDCHLCCKLPQLNDLDNNMIKPSYSWCKNCTIGKGCDIYETRPDNCKGFKCLYKMGLLQHSPHKIGFFVFPEEKSDAKKVLVLYVETHKVHNLDRLVEKEPLLVNLLEKGWKFVVRYNSNDNDRAVMRRSHY